MAEPYIGEIRLVSFNFAPKGWALCNGQTLPISQNTALFSLMGTYYGGNGVNNFQLPNLEGRVIVHMGATINGSSYTMGEAAGAPTVEITDATMPKHSHTLSVVTSHATGSNPANLGLAVAPASFGNLYGNSRSTAIMPATTIQYYGSNVPHSNVMPYLTLNYIVALQGIYPSRT